MIGGKPDLIKIEAPNSKRNFVVKVLTRSGDISLVINKVGAYTGTAILPEGTMLVMVNAVGPWKATITAK